MPKLNLPHFVFINGPAGSGKDTLANLICAQEPSAYKEGFAEPIREMIYSVFFPEMVLERPFDLSDQTIKSKSILSLAKIEPQFDPDFDPTVREAMIGFSEDFMKKKFGTSIFGRLLWNRCCEQSVFYEHFIISDSGFLDEAKFIISKVGADACHLIRLHRRGCSYSGDSRGYISLEGVQTLDLHNDGAPDDMLQNLQLEFGNL